MQDLRKYLLGVMALWSTGQALAATPPPSEVTGENVAPISRRFEMAPTLSVITLSRLSVPNPLYNVAYLPQLEGMPSFLITVGKPFAQWNRLVFTAQATVGYGAKTGSYMVTQAARLTAPPQSQSITLRWIPMILSTKVSVPGFTFLRPSLTVGVGTLALVQEASAPGLGQTSWIPMLTISPQITFQDLAALRWLGGFSFGATIIRGLSPNFGLAALSWDLSLNFLL